MVILGIDPGYAIIGFGLIRPERGRFIPIEYGAILTDADQDFPGRLEVIYRNMTHLMEKWHPDAMAVEKLYFNTNSTTAIDVAQARGVIVLSARQNGVAISEYTPLQVKQAITGYGRAEKHQVMEMVKNFLKLSKVPKPDDTSDALALAICHAHYSGGLYREAAR